MKDKQNYNSSKIPWRRLVLFTSFGVLLDQLSKIWVAREFINPLELTNWFRIVYEENSGIAFSIPIPYPILITLNFLLFAFLTGFLITQLNWRKKISLIAFSFFVAGGLGNFIDRIRLGYVIDFISISNFPVFNLADSFISVSVFLLLLFYDKINRLNKEQSHGGK